MSWLLLFTTNTRAYKGWCSMNTKLEVSLFRSGTTKLRVVEEDEESKMWKHTMCEVINCRIIPIYGVKSDYLPANFLWASCRRVRNGLVWSACFQWLTSTPCTEWDSRTFVNKQWVNSVVNRGRVNCCF